MSDFGKDLQSREFLLDKDVVHINHGSWGTVPRVVQEERIRWMSELENSPDHWFRRTIEGNTTDNLKVAASFLGSDPGNLVFVGNATSGCNAVLKSVPLKPGDAILINSYTYGAIKNTALSAAEIRGAEVLVVGIPLEIKNVADVVEIYRKFIQKHKNIKLLVLDYISSATALLYPVKEIAAICKENGVLLLLDGAHSPGHLPVNLEQLGEMGVDFYTGNFHKWVFAPRGCAVLWCHPRFHGVIRPPVTSHDHKAKTIQKEFLTQGTKDDTPYLCVKKAVEFYTGLGGREKIFSYASDLLDKATVMLAEAWDTELFPVPKEMQAPFLRLVRLPDLPAYAYPNTQGVFCDPSEISNDLFIKHKIAATALGVYGKMWVRLSGFVYNTMEDYERLRDVILIMKKQSPN